MLLLHRLQVEREWRRKEREEAIRKAREEEELNAARRKQIEDQRRAYALEIQREKEESEKIAKLNTEDIEKSKELDEKNKMVSLIGGRSTWAPIDFFFINCVRYNYYNIYIYMYT